MSELTIQSIAIFKLILLVNVASLYAFGGMDGKWKRRYLAPLLLVGGFIAFSLWQDKFSWWILLCYPLYVGAFSMGYGADDFWIKVLKRGDCGAAIACASLPLALSMGMIGMWFGHLFLMTGMMIWLGVFNPTPNARNEETLLGVFSGLLPLFMI